ncbi:PTS sugar transporter subunit IIA [Salsuginibacillus kocurii]|uniref:PTS sugar transporter subunit IIA n=1 Tax=Salsuginibacillus kocurii TaxID=427078 RepID=UPI0003768E96|nr:PTS sugar transporter subunit IIA [Salsuginibacillus kocurii]
MSDVYFDESVILLDIEGTSNEEVLAKMGETLHNKGLVKESYVDAVIAREKEFPTGLPTSGISVALPHTDAEHVYHKGICIGVVKDKVEFGIMGDDSETTAVKLVFMLAMDEPHSQLSLLQQLMQIFQDEDTLKQLVNQTEKQAIKNLIEEKIDFTILKGAE